MISRNWLGCRWLQWYGGIAAETSSVQLTKHLRTVLCLRHRVPAPLWWPGSIPDNWEDVCGFLNHLALNDFGKCISMVHFPFPRKSIGLRPTDQSFHSEIWLHLDSVDRSNTWSKQGAYDQRISLSERPAECSYGNATRRIFEVMSDHSFSFLMCDRSNHDLFTLQIMTFTAWVNAFFLTEWPDDHITCCTVRKCLMSKKDKTWPKGADKSTKHGSTQQKPAEDGLYSKKTTQWPKKNDMKNVRTKRRSNNQSRPARYVNGVTVSDEKSSQQHMTEDKEDHSTKWNDD